MIEVLNSAKTESSAVTLVVISEERKIAMPLSSCPDDRAHRHSDHTLIASKHEIDSHSEWTMRRACSCRFRSD